MRLPKSTTLQTLFSPDAQTAEWMAAARTPSTRTRIRRWSRVETVGIATSLVGIALLILVAPASIAVAVWCSVTDRDPAGLLWWIGGAAVGIVGLGILFWCLGTARRQAACYADGHESVGTVERATRHLGSGDDHTWWDLRISAVLTDGTTLRRRLHLEGEHHDRRIGGLVRFRHNTLDPETLDDIHFTGWTGASSKRRS